MSAQSDWNHLVVDLRNNIFKLVFFAFDCSKSAADDVLPSASGNVETSRSGSSSGGSSSSRFFRSPTTKEEEEEAAPQTGEAGSAVAAAAAVQVSTFVAVRQEEETCRVVASPGRGCRSRSSSC